MRTGIVGRREKEEFPKLLWETETKNKEDAIEWASNLAQKEKVFLQAVLVNDEPVWGSWNPKHKHGNFYHVEDSNSSFYRECINCKYYFGAFDVHCSLFPSGNNAKDCTDFLLK